MKSLMRKKRYLKILELPTEYNGCKQHIRKLSLPTYRNSFVNVAMKFLFVVWVLKVYTYSSIIKPVFMLRPYFLFDFMILTCQK